MQTHVHRKMLLEVVELLPSSLKPFFNGSLNGHRIKDIIANGAYIEDTTAGPLEGQRGEVAPWLEHFWQQNLGRHGLDYSTLDTLTFGNLDLSENRAAYRRADDYWNDHVLKKWKEGAKEEALLNLGRIIHLIQDMGVPAHTNNDMHLGIGIEDLYDDDDFEDYVSSECKPIIPNKYKITTELNTFFNSEWELKDYFLNFAKETIKYDSDDVDGKGSGLPYRHPYWTIDEDEDGNNFFRDPLGDLTDWGCNAIAKNLMPLSYTYSASFLIKFLKEIGADINSLEESFLGKKYQVDMRISSLTLKKGQDVCGVSEVLIQTTNGKQEKTTSIKSMEDGDSWEVSQELESRFVSRNESITLFLEVQDDDATYKELIGKIKFVINYDTFKNYIDKETELLLEQENEYLKLAVSIVVKTVSDNSYDVILENIEPLKFYSLEVEGLDKEMNNSVFGFFAGKDDVRIKDMDALYKRAIISNYDKIDLIEYDYVGENDDVSDFTWEKWKEWIGTEEHIEPVKIDKSTGLHRVKFKIKEYENPNVYQDSDMKDFEVNIYLHSIEQKNEDGKCNVRLKKQLAHKLSRILLNSDIEFQMPLEDRAFNVKIPKELWKCWIQQRFGLYTFELEDLKCNFIIRFVPLKKSYKVTTYLDKIYVNYDCDPDYFGVTNKGDLYAMHYVGSAMIKKFELGCIGSKSEKKINRLLGNDSTIIDEQDTLSFRIKVMDYDPLNENDSLGTVEVNIPASIWNSWDDKKEGHITTYIDSNYKKRCSMSFKFIIDELNMNELLSGEGGGNPSGKSIAKNTGSENNYMTGVAVSLEDVLKSIPRFDEAKLTKPLVDKVQLKNDENFYFYYSNLDNDLILHHKDCYHLDKINPENRKKLYLTRNDLEKLQKTKNINSLHPDNAEIILEERLNEIPKMRTKLCIDQIRTANLSDFLVKDVEAKLENHFTIQMLRSSSREKSLDENTVKDVNKAILLGLDSKDKLSRIGEKIIRKHTMAALLEKDFINKKIDKVKNHRKFVNNETKDKVFSFRKILKEASICKYCEKKLFH